MTKFNSWMDKHNTDINQLDEMTMDKVDSGLQSVHALLQEHAEQQPVFNTIYSEVKKMASFSTPQEAATLNDIYSEISEKFQVNHATFYNNPICSIIYFFLRGLIFNNCIMLVKTKITNLQI